MARRPKPSTATISVELMDGDTAPHFGGRVTFAIQAPIAMPYVHLQARQNGQLVLDGRTGFFPTALGNQWFELGPTPNWQGGAADCVATVEEYGKTWAVLGSVSFRAEA